MKLELYGGFGEGEEPSLKDPNKHYTYTKKCNCCGLEFKTNNPQKMFCNRTHYTPCPICGNKVLKKDNDFTRDLKCCSSKCSHELRKQHMPTKTCILCGKEFVPRTGVGCICDDDHYRNCEICGKSFLVDRTHVDVTTCSEECSKEKLRRFYKDKYGVDHPMQNPDVRKHHEKAMLDKYGVTHALKLNEIARKQQETVIHTNMDKYGVPYACMLPQCIESQGRIVSELNYRAKEYLESKGINVSLERRLDDYSFDLCIEDQKTLIEINPTYTHSIVPNHWGTCREFDYHLKKTQIAEKYGYRCIHIFDWEDDIKILNMLLPKTKIYARNCRLYKLNADVAKKFIDENHIQGNCRGQLVFLGLTYKDELYQVMSFGRPRYSKSNDVELLRLCTRQGYSIVGGASKIFQFAEDIYELNNIVSYCDISKFHGDVYEKLGMTLTRQTPPQEIWSKGRDHITANLLRQRGYDQLFGTNYGKGSDNEELMLENGWLPVYDCGMKVYEYKK